MPRRQRSAERAPRLISHTVFAQATSDVEPADAAAKRVSHADLAAVVERVTQYEAVCTGLEQARTTLRAARDARDFTLA